MAMRGLFLLPLFFAVATVMLVSGCASGPANSGGNEDTAHSKYKAASYAIMRREYEKAIAILDEAIALDPAARYFSRRGDANMELGRYEEAIADYDKSIELDPSRLYELLFQVLHRRGNAKHYLGRHEEAMADYDKAIALDPLASEFSVPELAYIDKAIAERNRAKMYTLRGNIRYEMGQYEEAMVEYNRAIELNPYYSEAIEGQYLVRQKLEQGKGR